MISIMDDKCAVQASRHGFYGSYWHLSSNLFSMSGCCGQNHAAPVRACPYFCILCADAMGNANPFISEVLPLAYILLLAVHAVVVFLVFATRDVVHPLLIVEIPAYGLFYAFFKL